MIWHKGNQIRWEIGRLSFYIISLVTRCSSWLIGYLILALAAWQQEMLLRHLSLPWCLHLSSFFPFGRIPVFPSPMDGQNSSELQWTPWPSLYCKFRHDFFHILHNLVFSLLTRDLGSLLFLSSCDMGIIELL